MTGSFEVIKYTISGDYKTVTKKYEAHHEAHHCEGYNRRNSTGR